MSAAGSVVGSGGSWIDVAALVVLSLCFLWGLSRGLLLQLLGLLLLAAAAVVALSLSSRVGAWIRAEVWAALPERAARAVGFVVLLLGALGISSFCLRLLRDSSRTVTAGALNRLLGGVLGAAKGAVLLMALALGAANLLHREGAEPGGFLADLGRSRAGKVTRRTVELAVRVLPGEPASALAGWARKLPGAEPARAGDGERGPDDRPPTPDKTDQ